MIEQLQQTILNGLHRRGIYSDKSIRRVQNFIADGYNIPTSSYQVAGYEQLSPFKEYKIVFEEGIGRRVKRTLKKDAEFKIKDLEDSDEFRVLKVDYKNGEEVHRNLGVINEQNNTVYLDFVTRLEDSEFEPSPRSQRTLEIFEAYFESPSRED